MPRNRQVAIRNVTSRNWTSGIEISHDSRVAISGSRFENNVNYGIEAKGNARVTISKTEVAATGYRLNPVTGNFPSDANVPDPGIGIEFDDTSAGTVFNSTVSGSFAAGIANASTNRVGVCVANVNAFDNDPDYAGVKPRAFLTSCGTAKPGSRTAKVARSR